MSIVKPSNYLFSYLSLKLWTIKEMDFLEYIISTELLFLVAIEENVNIYIYIYIYKVKVKML